MDVHGAAFVVEYSYSATADMSIPAVRLEPDTATDCDAEGVPRVVEKAVKEPVTLITGVSGLTVPSTALLTGVAPVLEKDTFPL